MDILLHIEAATEQLRYAVLNSEKFTPMMSVERRGEVVAIASGIPPQQATVASTLMAALFRGDAVSYSLDTYFFTKAIEAGADPVAELAGAAELFAAGHENASEALMVARVDALLADVRFATYTRHADGITTGKVYAIPMPEYPIKPADIQYAQLQAAAADIPDHLTDRQADAQALAELGGILQYPMWLASFESAEEAEEAMRYVNQPNVFVVRRDPDDD